MKVPGDKGGPTADPDRAEHKQSDKNDVPWQHNEVRKYAHQIIVRLLLLGERCPLGQPDVRIHDHGLRAHEEHHRRYDEERRASRFEVLDVDLSAIGSQGIAPMSISTTKSAEQSAPLGMRLVRSCTGC